MSLLDHLEFQKIDTLSDDISSNHSQQDDIFLNDQIDEAELENFWAKVVDDIHHDPEWFSFTDE
jgi:hypothetical protein